MKKVSSLASPRRIPAVGLCPPRSPRRLGTPVGRVTVLDSLLAFVVFSRMRGQVPLPSRKPPFGGIHPYTTEGSPGLYVRLADSSAVRGFSVESRTRIPSPHPTRRPENRPSGSASEIACLFQTFCVSLERRFDTPYKGRSVVITGKAVCFQLPRTKVE